MACVVFTVDERITGWPQASNDAVADSPRRMPTSRSRSRARSIVARRRSGEAARVQGPCALKLPLLQQFFLNDHWRTALRSIVEASARRPISVEVTGTGMRGGGGIAPSTAT
jgi:hypothetical protein